MTAGSLFVLHEQGVLPTEFARSPWSQELLHGGPVAALLAHSIEEVVGDPAYRLGRLTTDLFRPVPFAPLRIETELCRDGRLVKAVRASLFAGEVEVTRAHASLLATSQPTDPGPDIDSPRIPFPEDAQAQPHQDQSTAFANTVEWRDPTGAAPHFTRWIRVPLPILPGIELSPAVRAAAVSDFVSPLSNMRLDGAGAPFINADVTLYLHRPPLGEWLALAVTARDSNDGIAVSAAALHDQTGPVGRCLAVSIPLPSLATPEPATRPRTI